MNVISSIEPAEALRLARIREHELGAAAFRAEANHLQAIADRFRLEGNELQAIAFEASSDRSSEQARRHRSSYQELILGREPGADPAALEAIARDAAGLAPRDSASFGQ